jgi:hypothetical protein
VVTYGDNTAVRTVAATTAVVILVAAIVIGKRRSRTINTPNTTGQTTGGQQPVAA